MKIPGKVPKFSSFLGYIFLLSWDFCPQETAEVVFSLLHLFLPLELSTFLHLEPGANSYVPGT